MPFALRQVSLFDQVGLRHQVGHRSQVGDSEREPARLSVNGTGRIRRQASTARPASVGTLPRQIGRTLASGTCSLKKPCALNIELQTVAGAAAYGAAAISFACSRHRRGTIPVAMFATEVQRARLRLSSSFEGIGVACSFHRRRARFGAERGSKAASALASRFHGEPLRRTCRMP